MGLLDDAIREHLDLKRRRGADPAEVERAEHEALGPVRRNPIPGEVPPDDELTGAEEAPGAYDDDVSAYDEPAGDYDIPGETDWAEEPAASAPAPADTDPGAAPPLQSSAAIDRAATDPAGTHRAAADPAEAESWSASDADPSGLEPFPTAPAAAPRNAGGSEPLGPHSIEDDEYDDATVEYRIPEEPAAEEEGEDMLEETPEFLQDTPDHDRLWFEQRPPRDFDFDG